MTSALLTAALAIALASGTGLAVQEPDLASPQLRVEWAEFKKLYDAKKIEVVDVRAAEAFEAGHIPGARSVPLETVEKRGAELKKLGRPIVLYCA
jgi:rhodanese-related sulfurtransferase